MTAQGLELSACELFTGLPESELERLVEQARRIDLPAGEVLFRMGDDAQRLYVVMRGRVTLSLPVRIDGKERDLTVEEVKPNQIVGWSALVAPHKATMTARTLVPTELRVLERASLADLFEGDTSLGFRVMARVSEVVGRRYHLTQALWMRELQRGITAFGA